MAGFPGCRLLFIVGFLLSMHVRGQECPFFKEYPNEVKIRSGIFIDSLKSSGVDTILFYGVGIGESGGMAYGKIIWSTDVGVQSAEIMRGPYDKRKMASSLEPIIYNASENRQPLQFYLENRLDTVRTNPRELFWRSHDLLHFAFASVARTSTCFIAEDYLIRDYTHLRSRWIIFLNSSLDESRKPFKLYQVTRKSRL